MKTIRLTTILFLTCLVVSLGGCKKEIAQEDPTSTSILGEWAIRSYVITNFENGGKDIDDTKGDKPRPVFEFSNTGIFTSTLLIPYMQKTRYTLSGNKVTFEEEVAFDHAYFNYKISGKVLTLTRSDSFDNTWGKYTENTTVILDKL